MKPFLLPAILGLTTAACALSVSGAQPQNNSTRKEIEVWNHKYIAAHLRMDTAAILNMWQDDGVSLLQGMDPIQGKEAIAKFVKQAVA